MVSEMNQLALDFSHPLRTRALDVGDVVSFLTVLDRLPEYKFLVRCVCGTEKIVQGGNLTRRERPIRSCGCKAKELLSAARKIHGHAATREHSHSRTYQSWMSMKERCDSPKHK